MTLQQRLVLYIAVVASFIGGLDGFIVNVALPAISHSVGGGLSVQQWTVDAYLLTLGAFILIAGSLSDLIGRKKILTLGLWWFGISSLLCALASNATFLIIARALQGVGGALLVPSSLALIVSAFKGSAQGKAIGTWTSWTSVSPLVGPLLGGLIIGTVSWRWIFAVNVPPIALALWLLRNLQVSERTQPRDSVDIPGAILCAIGLAGPVSALIEQPQYGWSNPRVWLSLLVGIVVLIAFTTYERRHAQPMLPLSLFNTRNFSVGNLATLCIYAGLSLSSFILIIVLQQVGHYSALKAGMAMVPVTILMFLLASRAGTLAGKYGPRWFMAAGPAIAALGFVLMIRINTPIQYWTELFPGIIVFGLGLCITVAPLTSAILGSISPEQSGIASAVNNAVARVAGLLAVALAGLVVGQQLDIQGLHRILAISACLMMGGAVISAIGITNHAVVTDRTP